MKQRDGSWLSLLTFCAVTAIAVALGFGTLFAGVSVAFAGADSPQIPVSDAGPREDLAASALSDDPKVQVAASQASHVSQVKTADEDGEAGEMFAGVITDSRCRARHSRDSGKASGECARSCIRNGAHFVLVDGEKTHALEGDATQLDRLAGVRVELVGMLEGNTIKVKSITAR